MTSQTQKYVITIHIFPNISRSKGNQAMKFGQFINKSRSISPENSCTKWGGETSSEPFLENQNSAFLRINSVNNYTVFLLFALVKDCQNLLETRCWLFDFVL